MTKRIYTTTDKTGTKRLIRAGTSHQAVAHHARCTIQVHVSMPDELIETT